MKKYDTLFPSKNAFRIATVLLACAENDMKEILVPDIAHKAMIDYGVALYWIDVFATCGFIRINRYENRENEICYKNRHIIVHLTTKKRLSHLYNYMWLQKWEQELMDDLSVKSSHLTLIQNVA